MHLFKKKGSRDGESVKEMRTDSDRSEGMRIDRETSSNYDRESGPSNHVNDRESARKYNRETAARNPVGSSRYNMSPPIIKQSAASPTGSLGEPPKVRLPQSEYFRTPSPGSYTEPLVLPKINTKISLSSEVSSFYDSSPNSPPTPTNLLGAGAAQKPDDVQISGNLSGNFSPANLATLSKTPENMSPMRKTTSMVSSTSRRALSDKVKTTPSSYVRHSRIYSQDFEDSHRTIGNSPIAPEMIPIVNLINAQKLRTYKAGNFQVPGVMANDERIWLEVDAKLSGYELAIWRPSDDEYSAGNDEFKPKYINMIDSNIEVVDGGKSLQLKISQDYQNSNSMLIKFNTPDDFKSWLAAMHLTKYEYISLNEAFTASILSCKGTKLSDIHILLSSKKRFPKYEWCNLRLPQISSKWLKVYLAIIPGDSKRLGRIEMYLSDKISKKNLILYIASISNVFNVFPEHSNMIDFNSIMKLNGDIFVNKNFEYLFSHLAEQTHHRSLSFKSITRNDSSNSLSSMGSRNVSAISTSSFFNKPEEVEASTSPKKNRQRSLSTNSAHSVDMEPKRASSFLKKNIANFVTTNYLYLMPIAHPGVTAVEIMIRNFIHIIDAFRLYGRPEGLISDKKNPSSLLFGLPSLPHYQYLSMDTCVDIVGLYFDRSMKENWNEFQWREMYSTVLSQQYLDKSYRGMGDITQLYDTLDIDFDEISSPTIALPTDYATRNFTDYSNTNSNDYSNRNSDDYSNEFSKTAHKSRIISPNEYSRTTRTPPVPTGEYDNFSTYVASPTQSEHNYGRISSGEHLLGDPIELAAKNQNYYSDAAPAQNNPNLRLDRQDLVNFRQENTMQDRSLEPIIDLPTPIDESHPYKNMINLSLNDTTVRS